MRPVPPRGSCANHPGRPGSALCMACRKVVCQECATPWEGIHYCSACLGSIRGRSAVRSPLLGWVSLLAAIGFLLYAVTVTRAGMGAFFASLR